MATVPWSSVVRVALLVILLAAIVIAFVTLPIEKGLVNWNSSGLEVLRECLIAPHSQNGVGGGKKITSSHRFCSLLLSTQTSQDRISRQKTEDASGFGEFRLFDHGYDGDTAVAYIPLTVLAVPASVLTAQSLLNMLGGGYLFGLPLGFVADSVGATIGATAAFLLGRTKSALPTLGIIVELLLLETNLIGRPYVLSKLNDYAKFQAVAIAIERSGFKSVPDHMSYRLLKEIIVLLLRLTPLLPFNMLNYLLSVTPIGIGEYMMASCLGMMPITFALVYVGTTLKDLADVTHGWSELSPTRWVKPSTASITIHIHAFLFVDAVLIACVARVAKASLEKALAESVQVDALTAPSPVPPGAAGDLLEPLVVKIDPSRSNHEK
ncbi:SNARE associated Golgi protein [Musa troglodytarum]|uniref:SNARE associated Golgi protein n=1 Tax=Musa troglodytarum TaxID=320322 RepID=A0A9E7H9U6_9LILI|nr:SNARE associated Golgi protein [Musa troglodytarum]